MRYKEAMEAEAFARFDASFDQATAFWRSLIEKESPFWDKPAVDAAVSFAEEHIRTLGLSCERKRCRTTGDGLIVTSPAFPQGEHGITLMAHLDTVHAIGAFGVPTVREEGGWLYGPGAGDCKGGAVMAIYILHALAEAGYTDRPLQLILVGNEEGGRPEAENFIPEALIGCDALFNCETGRPDDTIVTSRKSSIGALFTVSGKAGHVGNLTQQPASAIRAAIEKIRYLESLSDYDNRVFSCGEITGGSVFTSVPATCTFKVNCRIRSAQDIDWLKQTLLDTAAREDVPGTTATVQLTGNIIPMAPSVGNDALFERFENAAAALGYGPYSAVHSGGGSDASYAVMAGVPVICATGVLSRDWHTLNERACIADMKKRAHIHIKTILDLPEGPLPM